MKRPVVAASVTALAAALTLAGPQPVQAVSGTYTVQGTSVIGLPASEQVFVNSGCSDTVRNSAINGLDAAFVPLSAADANRLVTVRWTGVSKTDIAGGPIAHVYNSACRQVIVPTRVTGPSSITVQLPSNGAWLVLGNNFMVNITYTVSS